MFFQQFIELGTKPDPYRMDGTGTAESAGGPVEDAGIERYGALDRLDNI